MKYLIIIFLLFTFKIAHAETNIAILDIKKIISESIAAKKASQKIKSKLSEYQLEIDLKSSKLKKEQDKLLEQASLLTQEAMQNKQAEFVKKIKALELEVNKKKENLDKINISVISEIEKNIDIIVQKIALDKDINLVFSKSEIILTREVEDITEKVTEELNTKLTEIKINFEDGK